MGGGAGHAAQRGHRRGVEALRRTVRAAGDLGIGILTIFSFSAENWARPASEVRELMGLLRRFIRNDLAELHNNGVHVRVIGERNDLAPDIRRLLEEAEELTLHNDKLTLVVAFNYGGRQEIARAAQRLAVEVAEGRLPAAARDTGSASPPISTRRTCPIPTSSFAPAASSACPISCSGRPPTASLCSFRPTGRTSTARRSKAPSPNIAAANAGLAV